jgi:hypothetical protein
LYVALPGRIERLSVPDGSAELLTANGAVISPRALAPVRTPSKHLPGYDVPGMYFFDEGSVCWLDRKKKVVTTVRK